MADAFATAFIEILPDMTKFKAAVAAQSPAAMAPIGAAAVRESKKVEQTFLGMNRSTIKTLGKLSLGVAAAIGVIVAESVHLGAGFEATMETLHTQAGVAQSAIAGLGKGVLGVARQVGFGPNNLAQALYHIESSFASTGITGKKAMELLTTAAKGAKVGHADLVEVTNALDAAVVANIPGVQNLDQAMGILNATVGAGDMSMGDLAKAMGTGAVAVVKGFGLSIKDVGAALAVFGDNNIRGAQAGTTLRVAVQAIAKPVGGADVMLKRLGLSAVTLAKDMQHGGLNAALTDLKNRMDHAGISAKQQGQVLVDLFGKKAGTGVSILIGQFDRLQSKYVDLTKGANGFGDAWAQTQKTFRQQWDVVVAKLKVIGTQIGLALLPAAKSLLNAFGQVVDYLSTHTTQFKILAIAVGVTLVTAFTAWTIAATMAAAATLAATWPVFAVAAAIDALTVGLIYAYTHFTTFRNIVDQVWRVLKMSALATVNWFINTALPGMRSFFTTVGNVAMWLWHNVFVPVWNAIQFVVRGAVTYLSADFRVIQGALHVVGAVVTWLYQNIFKRTFQLLYISVQIFATGLKIAFGLVMIATKILGSVISWLWRSSFSPVFHQIGAIISWLVNNVTKPLFKALGDAVSYVWNKSLKPVFNAFADIISKHVAPAFKTGVDAISRAWSAVQEAAKAPVRFVVNTVINKGIIGPYNKLAGFFKVHQIGEVHLPKGFSSGGVFDEPTAIVGEGDTSRPEYVIPTDPRHRNRALQLYSQLGAQLMAGGGILGDIGNILLAPGKGVASFFKGAIGQANSIANSPWGSLVAAMPKAIASAAIASVEKLVPGLGGILGAFNTPNAHTRVGGGVMRWAPIAMQALAYTHSSMSWLGSLLNRMQRESGGNQYAINLTDINAQHGDPSRGLMQTIMSTFLTYARELAGRGIYDPFANIVASIRYTVARYGSGPAGWDRAGGYDNGGMLPPGLSLAYNGTGRPEPVTPASHMLSKDEMIQAIAAGFEMALQHIGPLVEITPEVNGDMLNGIIAFKINQSLSRAAYAAKTGRR